MQQSETAIDLDMQRARPSSDSARLSRTADSGVCIVVVAAMISTPLAGARCYRPARRSTADPISAAYVLLGEGGAATARVITTDTACPPLSVDGTRCR